MSVREIAPLGLMPSGIPGLDAVLGGGFPEFSMNVIAGAPGTGKTSLAHQVAFANGRASRRSLYVTVLGEPPMKMARYQQQFTFFEPALVGEAIQFVHLTRDVYEDDPERVLEKIMFHVKETNPDLVIIDSFRNMVQARTEAQPGGWDVRLFLQRLAISLTSWHATSFLLGEYPTHDLEDPVLTLADGIVWLEQSVNRNSMVRRLQVLKMRGMAPMPGLHTFRISESGLRVYPRMQFLYEKEGIQPEGRVSTGVPVLDEMMGGGIPTGDAVLVAGPTGSGKTVLCLHFITEGIQQGERGVIAVFEEHPPDYIRRARKMGFDLETMIANKTLRIIYLRPLDLSVDETSYEILEAVRELGALRVSIDSLTGLELALAPTWREDFREALYRMAGQLTALYCTVLMTVEIFEAYTALAFSNQAISFLAQDVLLQRYVEIEGRLHKVLTVVKMRGSQHSKDIRAYEITSQGLEMREVMSGYQGLLSGRIESVSPTLSLYPGLTTLEGRVLNLMIELGEATADKISEYLGMRRVETRRALGRLVALNYVIRMGEKGKDIYRPVARVLQP